MEDVGLRWFIFIIMSLALGTIAYWMNERFKKKNPGKKPYAWGFFTGLCGIASSAIWALYGILSLGKSWNPAGAWFLIAYALAMGGSGLYVIKRRKFAWIANTILQLNPILWLINGFYARNRWSEFSTLSQVGEPTRDPAPPGFDSLHDLGGEKRLIRMYLAASFMWAVVVLAFVLLFDRYGYAPDWGHALKVIVAPPVILGIGGFVFRKAWG